MWQKEKRLSRHEDNINCGALWKTSGLLARGRMTSDLQKVDFA